MLFARAVRAIKASPRPRAAPVLPGRSLASYPGRQCNYHSVACFVTVLDESTKCRRRRRCRGDWVTVCCTLKPRGPYGVGKPDWRFTNPCPRAGWGRGPALPVARRSPKVNSYIVPFLWITLYWERGFRVQTEALLARPLPWPTGGRGQPVPINTSGRNRHTCPRVGYPTLCSHWHVRGTWDAWARVVSGEALPN